MKSLSIILLMVVNFAFSSVLMSWDDSPSCFKKLELHFFNPTYVTEAMQMSTYQETIAQSNWGQINNALATRSREVPGIMKTRANRMDRDPLEYPFQPEQAAALLHQVLFEIFLKVMKDYNVANNNDITNMFEYITRKQLNLLTECFGEAKFFK